MIEVKASGIHGRGVYAAVSVAAGTVFHVAHLLAFDCVQSAAVSATELGAYVFYIEDCPDGDGDRVGLAMSPMSFVNHGKPASAAFRVDPVTLTVAFSALRDIPAGEEITIDYGDFAEKMGLPA